MKKLGLSLLLLLIVISTTMSSYAFLAGQTPSPDGATRLNMGILNSADYTNLQGIINGIGTSNATVIMTTSLPLNQTITAPSNISWVFGAGGQIRASRDIAGSATLTINGPVVAPPGTTIFSGSTLSIILNLATTPVTYTSWGTFTTTGTAPQNLNLIQNFGLTSLVNGSVTVTFVAGSTYSSSISYATTANTQTTANAIGVNQTSGSSVTFTGTGTNKVYYNAVGN